MKSYVALFVPSRYSKNKKKEFVCILGNSEDEAKQTTTYYMINTKQ